MDNVDKYVPNKIVNAKAHAKRLSQVVAEWEAAGERPPLIGGVPVSRELLEQLRMEREAEG